MTLKSSIGKAIREGQRQYQNNQKNRTRAMAASERKAFQTAASKILKELPANIKKAAAKGESEVLIFEQDDASGDFHYNNGVDVSFTGGTGLLLEEALKKADIDYFVYVQGVLPVVYLVVMWKSENPRNKRWEMWPK